MDDIDITNERAERELAAALRQRQKAGPAFTGQCHFCGVEVGQNMRWCDAECRDGWEAECKSA